MSKAYVLWHLEKPDGSVPIELKGEEIWIPNRTQAQIIVDYINKTAELEEGVEDYDSLKRDCEELEDDIDDLKDKNEKLEETIASLTKSILLVAEDIAEAIGAKEEDYAENVKLINDIINQVLEGKR